MESGEENGIWPASEHGPGQPPPPASTARHMSGMPNAALSWKRNTMGDERGELINQGQKTASTSKTKPGETNEETKRKKRKIQNTNQTKKNPSKSRNNNKKKWNGCGAENRGLKGEGLWLPRGVPPTPGRTQGLTPLPSTPRASAATEVTPSQHTSLRGKPAWPHWRPSLEAPLSPLLSDNLPVT